MRLRTALSFCLFLTLAISEGFSQSVSLVPDSTEPRLQLTGESFQIFSHGIYFTTPLLSPTLSQFGVIGADLGYPVVYPDKIVFLFGDTFGAYPSDSKYFSAPGSGGDDSIGYIANTDLNACHYIRDVDQAIANGNPAPSVPGDGCPKFAFYKNPNAGPTDHLFMPTTIAGLQSGEDLGPLKTPNGGIDYNGRLYMSYVVTVQYVQPHYALESVLVKADQPNSEWSDTRPPTFTRLYRISAHPAVQDPKNTPPEANDTGKFMFNPMVALNAPTLRDSGLSSGLPDVLQNASTVIFVFGSSWRYNRSNLYLAAFSADDLEAGTSRWFYYSGIQNGSNTWSNDEKSAVPLLNEPANIGNHSVAWNPSLHRFILMAGNVTTRFSMAPWGPWSDPIMTFSPQSTWSNKLIHHSGQDPISRSLIPIFDPGNGQVVDLSYDTQGVPYGPYLIDKYTQNPDGSVTIFYTISTWNPYEVFLVSSTFLLGVQGGAIVSAADFDPAALSPGSIASIFALGLSDTVFIAAPPKTESPLGGKSVTVRDSRGVTHSAGLYYVSPNQINLVIPPDTAPGLATIDVIQGSSSILSLTAQVSPVAPALFSSNGRGRGAAAGFLVTSDSGGNTRTQPLFSCDTTGSCTPNPVNLGGVQQAFLELFGTGIGGVSDQGSVSVMVGGVAGVVTYAGKQGTYPGLDQVNVQFPVSQLRGRGVSNVTISVGGKISNSVQANFQ